MKFEYQSEKFSEARRALMLPHVRGEHESIASAFHECTSGLRGVDQNDLDENSRTWIKALEKLMNTSGLSDPQGLGLWSAKAKDFSVDDKLEIARLVDELAHWFRSRSNASCQG